MKTEIEGENNIYNKLILGVLLIAFIVIKWPYLNLPFYWDEAWVYGPAIQTMTENGIGLLPSSLPPELSRGHPLLFHFLGSLWGNIFGIGHFSLHVFVLLISLLTLTAAYKLAEGFSKSRIALLVILILGVQPMFLAQSGLVLPEMMLLLFVLLTLHCYIQKKWFWYFIFAAAAILTKESGLVVICATSVHFLLFQFSKLKSDTLSWFKRQLILLSPVLPWILFLIIQKLQNGWMFFPEHIDLVSLESNVVIQKFENYSALLFLYQGRKLFLIFLLASIAFILIRKVKLTITSELGLLLIFIFGFLAFSSLNYYSDRYLLTAVGPLVVFSIVLVSTTFKQLWMYGVVLVVSVSVFINMNRIASHSDHNLGYANGIKCHKDIVKYCIDHKMQEEKIVAYFLGRVALTDVNNGYLVNSEAFKNVQTEIAQDFEYIIFANFDTDQDFMDLKDKHKLELVYKTEHKQAWAEIHKRID